MLIILWINYIIATMSLETNRWSELSQSQASFFTAQVHAARLAVTSSAAMAASIVPLNASRYSFRVGGQPHQTFDAAMWPDPYAPQAVCVVAGPTEATPNSAFVRIAETEEAYEVEGVAVGLGYGKGAHLYGQQLILRHDNTGDLSPLRVAAEFLVTGMSETKRFANDGRSPLGIGQTETIGIEGATTARLFRSLSSLGSNLVIAGAVGEKGVFTDETYDLAQGLLKTVATSISRIQTAEAGSILWGTNGRPLGAVFDSERLGITVIRRTNDFPDTIALATVGRPRADEQTIFVDQHSIQSRGAWVDMMALPAEAYNPQSIVHALGGIAASPRRTDTQLRAYLDERSTQTLQHKILELLSERVAQPF